MDGMNGENAQPRRPAISGVPDHDQSLDGVIQKILAAVETGPHSRWSLCRQLGLSPENVDRALRALMGAGLVGTEWQASSSRPGRPCPVPQPVYRAVKQPGRAAAPLEAEP